MPYEEAGWETQHYFLEMIASKIQQAKVDFLSFTFPDSEVMF